MPRRSYTDMGYTVKRFRLMFSNKVWADLLAEAERAKVSVEAVIEVAVKRDLADSLAARLKRPGVYYDAQGREHEHADVPS